jgi:hypothetical protein
MTEIFWVIQPPHDCSFLQIDINSIDGWCIANLKKFNVRKIRVIAFTRKMNMIAFEYKLCGSCINRGNNIKDLDIFLDSKLLLSSTCGLEAFFLVND